MIYRVILVSVFLAHVASIANIREDRPSFFVTEESWSRVDRSEYSQLMNSIDLVYGTLFQNLNFLEEQGWGQFRTEVYNQSLMLRRLYLVFGLGNLLYQSQGEESRPWPFPLATCLTQGQRVSIVLDGVSSREFLNFITGNKLSLFYKRKYSSHGVAQKKDSTEIQEIKIKSILRRIKPTETILGMDFPFGGIGNPLPDGARVGPRGYEVSGRRLKKHKQLGHLHLYAQDFPTENNSVILIGIEGCAPGTSNQLGCNHNMFSGLKNQKVHRSVSGGAKWSKLARSYLPPSEYMGKTVHFTRKKFEDVTKKADFFLSLDEDTQKRIFKTILPKDGFYVTGFLWTYQGWTTE